MCVTHTHPLDEVTPLEPTMLPTGAIDCLTKTPVAGMKKNSFEMVGKSTPSDS